jgi:oxalate decarboxylase/phosphoglucose isomerase-like protein (cupin superfamily)
VARRLERPGRRGDLLPAPLVVEHPPERRRDISAAPPQPIVVPPGARHGFRNDGNSPVRILNIHAPAGFDRRIGLRD